jgi:hypothetical protein
MTTTEVLRMAREALEGAWPLSEAPAARVREAIAAIDEALRAPAAADGEPVESVIQDIRTLTNGYINELNSLAYSLAPGATPGGQQGDGHA